MQITGDQIIAQKYINASTKNFYATNPATGEQLPTAFYEASADEIDSAVTQAEEEGQLLSEGVVDLTEETIHIVVLTTATIEDPRQSSRER